MTIGEELKKTRNFLGLTQSEMCYGIVTDSFYSRVERNMSQICVKDLVAILNAHQIAVEDFFAPFDTDHQCPKYIFSQIKLVYREKDLSTLLSFKDQLSLLKGKDQIKYQLMLLTLEHKLGSLTEEEKNSFSRGLLKIGKWNKENLFDLDLLLPLISFSELKVLFATIFETNWQEKSNNTDFLTVLTKVSSDYLERAYQAKDLNEVKKMILFIRNLPSKPENFLAKLTAYYYENLFEGKDQKASLIAGLLKQNGVIVG